MSLFKSNWFTKELKLNNVFTIARGSKSVVSNVFLSLEKDGARGWGEAGPNTRYDETSETVSLFFDQFSFQGLERVTSPEHLEQFVQNEAKRVEKRLGIKSPESAKTAIEMAWLDWWGKTQNLPLWRLWENEKSIGPLTSYTIGLDEISLMQRKIKEADQYPLYKIKLGTDHDRDIIQGIRKVTNKPLRVDANEGWKTLDQAKKEIEFLQKNGIEIVEQPMHSSLKKELAELKKWSPVPIMADESFTGIEPLEEIAESFHIINIKLMKIGSMTKAKHTIQEAQELGLKVMIGCMIESSLAITAGGILALNCEYADLDGNLLISNDPFTGLKVLEDGKISLNEEIGIGVLEVD